MGVTITDVARAAHVSTATVSRYLNQPDLVSPDRQKQIAAAIAELNYVPNHMAKALTTNHTTTIGVIVPDIINVYYPPIVRGIEDCLDSRGYISFLCNTDQNVSREKRYIATLRSQQVAGILFVGSRPSDPALSAHLIELRKALPVLMINDDLLAGEIASIGNREGTGIYQAVAYLRSLGHQQIGFISSSTPLTTYRHKEQGFYRAMQIASLALNESWIIREEQEYEAGGFSAMQKLMDMPKRPSAVIAATDQMAVGAVHALLEKGYRMPNDYSIIGYSNSCISEATFPGITTVDQHGYQLGIQAAAQLISIIEGAPDDRSARYLDTRLVIRKSSGFWRPDKK